MINSNIYSQTGTWEQGQSPVGCDCYRTIHTKFKTKFQFFFMPIFGAMAIAPYGSLSLSARFYFMPILFNGALAKLNGVAKIIPNSQILINSLVLQEAKDSSEIENIITTHDELYRASVDMTNITNQTKEVQNYSKALLLGYSLVKDNKLLLKRDIVDIQKELEQNDAGIRRQSNTVLKNEKTG